MHAAHDRSRSPAKAPRRGDDDLRRAIEVRRRQQLATLVEPDYPASGTELISARLAEARAMQRASRMLR